MTDKPCVVTLALVLVLRIKIKEKVACKFGIIRRYARLLVWTKYYALVFQIIIPPKAFRRDLPHVAWNFCASSCFANNSRWHARNEAHQQPVFNLQIARAYLAA